MPTDRGEGRKRRERVANRHTQSNPPTISEEPESLTTPTESSSSRKFVFSSLPLYMIINLLLFLTFRQQQQHIRRRRRRRGIAKSFALSVRTHSASSSSQGKLLKFSEYIFASHPKKKESKRRWWVFVWPSYDYKVNDVRKLPNHIALDSACDRTQRGKRIVEENSEKRKKFCRMKENCVEKLFWEFSLFFRFFLGEK